MKRREELYCRICKSPSLLRVKLVPNSQHVQKDVLVSESRKSDVRENEVHQQKERLVAVTIVLIFESLAFHVRCWSSGNKSKRKSSTVNLGNSKGTQTGTCCWRTARNPRRSTTSVRNQRMIWLLKWAITEIFDFLEISSKRHCPDCVAFLGNWYRILHMRKMHAAIGKKSTVEQRQIWLIVGSWIRNKEEPVPRSQAWSINASSNASHKAKDMLRKAKLPKNGSCETFLESWSTRCSLSKVIVWWRWDRRYTCRMGTMEKELENCFEQSRRR